MTYLFGDIKDTDKDLKKLFLVNLLLIKGINPRASSGL